MNFKIQDQYLRKYNEYYKKQNISLMDEIENVTNMGFEYEDLNKYADSKKLSRFRRETLKIIELDVLSDYQGYTARKMLNKRRLKNKDILLWLIIYKYAYCNYLLKEFEKETIKNINDYFIRETKRQCQEITKRDLKINNDKLFNEAMDLPNNLGYEWDVYRDSIVDYDANEMYQNIITNLREGKELIDKDLLDRQKNRIINVKKHGMYEDRYFGTLDNQVNWVTSYGQMQIFYYYGIEEVRIMGILDEKTCEICEQYIGEIYPIDEIVIGEHVNSHINCRCYLEAWK